MILFWLVIVVLCSLSKAHGDIETEAIAEAVKSVDGYKQLTLTAGHTLEGRTDYATMYIFSRHDESHEVTEPLSRSAKIANLATQLIFVRGGIPNVKTFQAKMAPLCALPKLLCDPFWKYRTIDGSCNNLQFPLWGKSLTAQLRFLPSCYDDKYNLGFVPRVSSKLGGPLPNPRHISNVFNSQGSSKFDERSRMYNAAFTSFGQFLAHDMSSTPHIRDNQPIECCKGDIPVNRPECFSFSVPPGEFQTTCMSFVRSQFLPYQHCAPGERNQMNQATSYIDLSVVYGSTPRASNELVDWKTGLLISGPHGLLPDGPRSECMGRSHCFNSGDTRQSTVPELTVYHTLIHREHNRIVAILSKINPHWNGERLFHEARKILIGIFQHIVYSEYLPIVLGKRRMKLLGILPVPKGYKTIYRPSDDASVRNSFAVGAFRFGHGQILNKVGCAFADRKLKLEIPLANEFFKTRTIRDIQNFGPDGISRWMTTEFNSGVYQIYADSMRNMLFQSKPGDGFDLAALDIQRGRDHGIPSYNKFRKFCGLKPAVKFGAGSFGLPDHDQESAKILSSLYKHVDDIDLITGGISEIRGDGQLGPTFSCLIGLQFSHSRFGDRFFYENEFPHTGFTPVQLDIIKQQTLSALLCRNFKMGTMQPAAFVSALVGQPAVPCIALPQLGVHELSAWKELPIKH